MAAIILRLANGPSKGCNLPITSYQSEVPICAVGAEPLINNGADYVAAGFPSGVGVLFRCSAFPGTVFIVTVVYLIRVANTTKCFGIHIVIITIVMSTIIIIIHFHYQSLDYASFYLCLCFPVSFERYVRLAAKRTAS